MKIDRYEMYTRFDGSVELVVDPDGSVCYTRDVEKLEASNAELLKGLEAIENGVNIGLPMGEILHIAKKYRKAARAAIAKAKGEEV